MVATTLSRRKGTHFSSLYQNYFYAMSPQAANLSQCTIHNPQSMPQGKKIIVVHVVNPLY